MSSKPWVKYHTKPGPACSKPKVKKYKPGPAGSKREDVSSPHPTLSELPNGDDNQPSSSKLQEPKTESVLEKPVLSFESIIADSDVHVEGKIQVTNGNVANNTDLSVNKEQAATKEEEATTITVENISKSEKDDKISDSGEITKVTDEKMDAATINKGKDVSETKDPASDDNESDTVKTLQEYDASEDVKTNELTTSIMPVTEMRTEIKAPDNSDAQSSSDLIQQTTDDDKQKQSLDNMSDEDLMKELSKEELMKVLTTKNCVCPCGYIIPDIVMCSIHKTIHAASNPLKCSECNVVFDNYKEFQEHLLCKSIPE